MNKNIVIPVLIISFFLLGYILGNRSQHKSQIQQNVQHVKISERNTTTPLLSDVITYTIPQGWKKVVDPSTPDLIEIRSPDYHAVELAEPGTFRGAEIQLFNPSSPVENTLAASVVNNSLIEGGTTQILRPALLGMKQSIREFHCFEGCMETYSFQRDKYVYSMTFVCSPNCDSEQQMDKSLYAKDRDVFLKSIVFK